MDYDFYDRLLPILDEERAGDTVYVYRLDQSGHPVTPYCFRCQAWPNLLEVLRDKYGGGEFKIMVRRGRTMLLTGTVAICTAAS